MIHHPRIEGRDRGGDVHGMASITREAASWNVSGRLPFCAHSVVACLASPRHCSRMSNPRPQEGSVIGGVALRVAGIALRSCRQMGRGLANYPRHGAAMTAYAVVRHGSQIMAVGRPQESDRTRVARLAGSRGRNMRCGLAHHIGELPTMTGSAPGGNAGVIHTGAGKCRGVGVTGFAWQ